MLKYNKILFFVLAFSSGLCVGSGGLDNRGIDPTLIFNTAASIATEAGKIASSIGGKRAAEKQGMFNIFSTFCSLAAVLVHEDMKDSSARGRSVTGNLFVEICETLEKAEQSGYLNLIDDKNCDWKCVTKLKSSDEKMNFIREKITTDCSRFVRGLTSTISWVIGSRVKAIRVITINAVLQFLAAEMGILKPAIDRKILSSIRKLIGTHSSFVQGNSDVNSLFQERQATLRVLVGVVMKFVSVLREAGIMESKAGTRSLVDEVVHSRTLYDAKTFFSKSYDEKKELISELCSCFFVCVENCLDFAVESLGNKVDSMGAIVSKNF